MGRRKRIDALLREQNHNQMTTPLIPPQPQIEVSFGDEETIEEAPPIYTATAVEIYKEMETPFGVMMVPSGQKTKPKVSVPSPEHPIPMSLYQQALAFMHWTFTEFAAEGMIYGFRNAEGNWLFEPPEQITQGMTVNAEDSNLEQRMDEQGYTLRFTLHHHCKIAAGQSATDTSSEHSQPSALHITVGDMERPNYSIHARLVIRGGTVMQLPVTEDQLPAFISCEIPDGFYMPDHLRKELFKCRTIIPFPEEWKAKIRRANQMVGSPGKPIIVGSYSTGQTPTTTMMTTGQSSGFNRGSSNGLIHTSNKAHFIIDQTPYTLKEICHNGLTKQVITAIKELPFADRADQIYRLLNLCDDDEELLMMMSLMGTVIPVPALIQSVPELNIMPDVSKQWSFFALHPKLFEEAKATFTKNDEKDPVLYILHSAYKDLSTNQAHKWDMTQLEQALRPKFKIQSSTSKWTHNTGITNQILDQKVLKFAKEHLQVR